MCFKLWLSHCLKVSFILVWQRKHFLIWTLPPNPVSLWDINCHEIPWADTVLETFAPARGFEVLVRSKLKGIPGLTAAEQLTHATTLRHLLTLAKKAGASDALMAQGNSAHALFTEVKPHEVWAVLPVNAFLATARAYQRMGVLPNAIFARGHAGANRGIYFWLNN